MVEVRASSREERANVVGAADYFTALATATLLEGAGLVIGVACWLRPQPYYYPAMLAMLVLMGFPMLWIYSRSFREQIRTAATVPALVRSRSIAWAAWPAAGLSAVSLSILGFALALSMPGFLGFAAAQWTAFGLALLNGARLVRERQRTQASRILVDVTNFPARRTFLTTRP